MFYNLHQIITTQEKKKKNKEGVIKAREESSLVGRSNHFGTRLRTLFFI
jgi:hypothetical protein